MREDLLTKGREALDSGAWEDARNFLTEAVRENASPEALEELAWAHWWLNDIPAVFATREKAYQAFIDNHDTRGASRTASWLGLDCLELSGEFAVASGWFQRAESLLEHDTQCKEYVLIKSLKANLIFRADHDPDAALKILDETLVLAKALNMAEGQMISEALKGFILVTEGRVPEGMKLLDEATVMALTDTGPDVRFVTTTCCFLIDACNRVRDFERADQWCVRVKEICKRWRHRAVFATCRTQYAAVLTWRGDWKGAEEELQAAIEELTAIRPNSVNIARIRLADLRRRQGRWSDTVAILDEIKSHWLKPLVAADLAFDREFFDEARQLAEKFLRQIPSHEKTERIAAIELLIRIYVQLGRIDGAKTALDELIDIEKAIATPPLRAARLSAEGTVAWALQQGERAKQHFEDAIDLYEMLECPFDASRVRLAVAPVLAHLGQAAQAEAEAQMAMKRFDELGAEKDLARARSVLKQMTTNEPAPSGAFSSRERAVLKLIAQGMNNETIAETLFLSVRTVEKHLTNIYQKLGVTGKSARAYAASWASRKLEQGVD